MKKVLIIATLASLCAGLALAQTPPAPPKRMTPPPPVGTDEAPPAVPSRQVILTDEEIRVTIQMLDECVKAKGMLCAEPAVAITRKLQAVLPK